MGVGVGVHTCMCDFACTVCSILYRVMAALNFLRYLLIRDKLVDNKVSEVEGERLELCIECLFACCYTDRGVEYE